MKRNTYSQMLFYICLTLLVMVSTATADERRQKVLVLHSYHQGLEWTDNISAGIQEVFKPFELEFELYYEYLDTKRNTGALYMESLYHLQLTKLSKESFSAVIVADNNALSFIVKYGAELFGEVPIIFCGVNNFTPELLERHANITGVVELTDYAATLQLIKMLHPDRSNIKVILDRTPTGDAIFADLHNILPQFPDLSFSFYRDFLLSEVETKVAAFDDHDVIYLLTFNSDRQGNFISYREGIEMIRQATQVPIYGSWDFYLGKGLIGGVLTRGFDQGHRAGEMALEILYGTPLKNIPVDRDGVTAPVFDYRELEQFGIASSRQLPENSVLINVPPTWSEKYAQFVLILAALLLIICSILGTRFFFIRRRNQLLAQEKNILDNTLKNQAQEMELEKLESQFAQVEKMNALGALAGGVAHDFNNILSGIFAYVQLAAANLDKRPEKAASYLDQIYQGARRASELVNQILTVSRRAEHEMSLIDMSIIIKEAIKFLRSSIPINIKIRENIVSKRVTLADPTQIHQTVMNLCTNAYHAMKVSGGILSVSLEEIRVDGETSIPELEIEPGDYIRLEVSDTGAGMDAKTKKRIFEPYFTTKEVGEGTGLGLAVVLGIVKSHNGHISVSSKPGEGTTFRVYFPIIAKEKKLQVSSDAGREFNTGSGHILLVDDEETLRESTRDILEFAGYQVTTAVNGEEALKKFTAAPQTIDLVLSDVTMPHMPGPTLAKELLKINPHLPIILCSGHGQATLKEELLPSGVKGFIQKPIDVKELLRNIRSLLE